MEGKHVSRFWAVTMSGSLYEIDEERNEKRFPRVEKIDQRNPQQEGSEVHVGDRLANGTHVGITGMGIVLFYPRGRNQTASEINTAYWGGSTSQVVGLFLGQDQARACLAAGSTENWDEQWAEHTKAVVTAIAAGHDVFRLDDTVIGRYEMEPIEVCPLCDFASSRSFKNVQSQHKAEAHPEPISLT